MMIIEDFPYTSITSYRNVKRKKSNSSTVEPTAFDSYPVRLDRKKTFLWILLCLFFYYFSLYLLKLSVVAKNCFPWTILMNCKWIIFTLLLNLSLSDHGNGWSFLRWGTEDEYQPSWQKLLNHNVLTRLVSDKHTPV